MVCIYCGSKTRVTNSRHQTRKNNVWRRRECRACHNVFTSVEKPEWAGSVVIRKQNDCVEPFVREKLLISVYESCRHRKTAINDATWLTETIVGRLQSIIENAALDRKDIISVTSGVLKRFDKAAHVQYLAFHPTE